VLKRRRLVLALLDRAGGSASPAWVRDAAFLVSRDRDAWAASPLYDFVPHADGPRSFSLERDLDAMERDGLVAATKDSVSLTPSGRAETATIDPAHARALRSAWHRDRLEDQATLAERIAAAHPWYAAKAPRPRADVAIYTAGYRGSSIDAFLDALLRQGIERIVDVRANPASRRLGFHKSTLRRLAGEVGIAYEHLPRLGVAKELRAEALSNDEINRMFEDYAVRVRAMPDDLDALAALLRERPGVLVCAETKAADCHRSRLATAVAERSGLPVVHVELHEDGAPSDANDAA
jgi:hypothetical protein